MQMVIRMQTLTGECETFEMHWGELHLFHFYVFMRFPFHFAWLLDCFQNVQRKSN